MISIIKGDITNAKENIICHQVNCQGVMGSGVAKALFTKYPQMKKDYLEYYAENSESHLPEDLLGRVIFTRIAKNQYIASVFGQLSYGRHKGVVYTNYEALEDGLKYVGKIAGDDKSIAIPYFIGCGLANGSWDIVYDIIDCVLGDKNVVLYQYKGV